MRFALRHWRWLPPYLRGFLLLRSARPERKRLFTGFNYVRSGWRPQSKYISPNASMTTSATGLLADRSRYASPRTPRRIGKAGFVNRIFQLSRQTKWLVLRNGKAYTPDARMSPYLRAWCLAGQSAVLPWQSAILLNPARSRRYEIDSPVGSTKRVYASCPTLPSYLSGLINALCRDNSAALAAARLRMTSTPAATYFCGYSLPGARGVNPFHFRRVWPYRPFSISSPAHRASSTTIAVINLGYRC